MTEKVGDFRHHAHLRVSTAQHDGFDWLKTQLQPAVTTINICIEDVARLPPVLLPAGRSRSQEEATYDFTLVSFSAFGATPSTYDHSEK
jgi:hypothetical protein